MDLGLFMRVFWRFRVLIGVGIVLAILAAFMSTYKIGGKPFLKHRQAETWGATATLFITQPGFPWGRSDLPTTNSQASPTGPAAGASTNPYGDPARFTDLAVLYSQLANSDAVQTLMKRSGVGNAVIAAQPGFDRISGDVLPLVELTATAQTKGEALVAANRATTAFGEFLRQRQIAAGIPGRQRVLASVINRAEKPQLVNGRSKTKPVVIFLGVLFAFFGLAAVLENLRPQLHEVRAEPRQAASKLAS